MSVSEQPLSPDWTNLPAFKVCSSAFKLLGCPGLKALLQDFSLPQPNAWGQQGGRENSDVVSEAWSLELPSVGEGLCRSLS